MNSVAVIAGSISTALFVASTLPMLYKAARTKELGSYSLGYLALANVGNGFYTVYVISLPVGPIWALHGFYLVSSALMLLWYLRYEVSKRFRLRRGWTEQPNRPEAVGRLQHGRAARGVYSNTAGADRSTA
jgi:uncharacterized protein with PQ loop repeat